MIKNIGIVLNHLGASQLAYLAIHNANTINKKGEHELLLFFKTMVQPCLVVQAACMHIAELYSFTGTIISTDIDSNITVINIPTACKKVFYVWDLEWLRDHKDYKYNMVSLLKNYQFTGELKCL